MRIQFEHTKLAAVVTALPEAESFIAPLEQTAADLGYAAAEYIFARADVARASVGALVFCSKTPDYRSPATACVLQGRLGLSTDCAVFDLNSGSVGFLHGLQTVAALMEASGLEAGLLIAGDTTRRQFQDVDPAAASYGDGAVALLLVREEDGTTAPLVVECGSESAGWSEVLFAGGGFRYPETVRDFDSAHALKVLSSGHLKIDPPALAASARRILATVVPPFAESTAGGLGAFGAVLVQQMSAGLVTGLRSDWGLSAEKLPLHEGFPDLCAASLPALLADHRPALPAANEHRFLACAFGEGLSWGCADFSLDSSARVETIRTNEVFADGAVSRNF